MYFPNYINNTIHYTCPLKTLHLLIFNDWLFKNFIHMRQIWHTKYIDTSKEKKPLLCNSNTSNSPQSMRLE